MNYFDDYPANNCVTKEKYFLFDLSASFPESKRGFWYDHFLIQGQIIIKQTDP